MASRPDPRSADASQQHRILALLLSAGVTYSLSQTLILPAMPALVDSLGASPLSVSWLLSAYLVAASVATPVIGRLGDLLGRGRVLVCVMAIFCAGSVICALGDSLPALVVGRVLQGAAGGVFPLAYGVIRDTFPPETRMQAIGSLSISLGVGAALGPGLAGVIVDHAGPAAVFWAGMIGALPGLFAGRMIPDVARGTRSSVDWLGAGLLAAGVATLVVLLTQGRQLGWASPAGVGLAVAAVTSLAVWVRVERRQSSPLVDIGMLRRPAVMYPNLASFFVGCGMFMAYVPLAPIAQAPESTGYGFGWSVAAAGALLVPHGLVQVVVGPSAGRLCARAGARLTLVLGALVNAGTIAGIALLHENPLALVAGATLLGVGQGLVLPAMANLIVAVVPREEVGVATGVNVVMRTIGMAVGSSLSAAILATGLSPAATIPGSAYVTAFIVAAATMAGAVVCAVATPATAASAAGRVRLLGARA